MKIIPLLYIVALLFTSVVWGAVSDIVVGQRAGANQRFVQRVVTGTANPLKPVGFNSDGTFGAISQIRGVTLGTPDGLSNIDITTNGTIRITANGTNSINTSTRKLFNSSGTEVFDWNSNILQGNWTVGGSFKALMLTTPTFSGDSDFGGFNANNINTVNATRFVGDGSGLTLLSANDLVGTIPNITTETLTTARSRVITPVAGVNNIINTNNGDTTITLDATTEVLTYSAQPATGTRFEYTLTGHTVDSVVTIPSTYSHALGSLRTSFTVPANKNINVIVKREAGRYVMWGDPVSIADYPINASPTVDDILEVDQGGNSTRSTLGQVKALIITNSKTGTHASPNTTTPISPTWNSILHNVYTGVTGIINLPAAASYAEKSITIYNTGAFTITIDSNGSEVIVRDGTPQTGGVSFTLSSGAGNYVTLICDGTRWITLGFKGTLTQGT